MSSNEVNNVLPEIADVFSLFDEQFSIADFQNTMAQKEAESDTVLSSVRRAVKEAADNTSDEEKTMYIVDFDDGIKEAIDSGDIKLDTNSSGEIFAQLRDQL